MRVLRWQNSSKEKVECFVCDDDNESLSTRVLKQHKTIFSAAFEQPNNNSSCLTQHIIASA